MDTTKYSMLLAALEAVPDPRYARRQRHRWRHLLFTIAAGLASNHQSARALAQWAQFHASTLRAILPNLRRLPSEATMLRALRGTWTYSASNTSSPRWSWQRQPYRMMPALLPHHPALGCRAKPSMGNGPGPRRRMVRAPCC